MNPAAVSADDIPDDADPEAVALLDQEFIKDASQTIADRINDVIASIGERIEVAPLHPLRNGRVAAREDRPNRHDSPLPPLHRAGRRKAK